jgi:hypothetical protein
MRVVDRATIGQQDASGSDTKQSGLIGFLDDLALRGVQNVCNDRGISRVTYNHFQTPRDLVPFNHTHILRQERIKGKEVE